MTDRNHHVLVVGTDRSVSLAASALADRARLSFRHVVSAHEALRQLATVALATWTVVVPSELVDLDTVAFVGTARDLIGDDALIVAVGIEPVSMLAAQLIDSGASRCIAESAHLDHPSLALGNAA